MKRLQLKYSTPKIKVNSVRKTTEQSQKKSDSICATGSTINKIISEELQSEGIYFTCIIYYPYCLSESHHRKCQSCFAN